MIQIMVVAEEEFMRQQEMVQVTVAAEENSQVKRKRDRKQGVKKQFGLSTKTHVMNTQNHNSKAPEILSLPVIEDPNEIGRPQSRNLEEEIVKVIETGMALDFYFKKKEQDLVEFLTRREVEDDARITNVSRSEEKDEARITEVGINGE
ncbi:hypothetical protein Q3G72_031118 [Acer saccharum]|nr:hypothetical protein Q3G72_031118 [Acer saccharum]